MYELIERINEAADVKKFTVDELDKLAVEIREALLTDLQRLADILDLILVWLRQR